MSSGLAYFSQYSENWKSKKTSVNVEKLLFMKYMPEFVQVFRLLDKQLKLILVEKIACIEDRRREHAKRTTKKIREDIKLV
ncbi:hypothetical protein QL285_091321 [Trifolium repens]|nr:hypothetical protein QL285_091321 [Trifolium repens]